ncbi:hypothetical protein RO07_02770 [Pandoraea pulmonicola]|uniref:Uncharacterized protein n=1 Tax=Pandoraea pulmonicola TaxID=93221 RepID=A0ABM5RW47_PANPU|nr:hypothetical protein RO07_02770 [Pandoraea pulmonicola]
MWTASGVRPAEAFGDGSSQLPMRVGADGARAEHQLSVPWHHVDARCREPHASSHAVARRRLLLFNIA